MQDPNLRVSATKLLNHRWIKASAQRMQQKAADSASAPPMLPAMPSGSSLSFASATNIETPAALEGKFVPPGDMQASAAMALAATAGAAAITQRPDSNGKKSGSHISSRTTHRSRPRSDDEASYGERDKTEHHIKYDTRTSGRQYTRSKDREQDRDHKKRERDYKDEGGRTPRDRKESKKDKKEDKK